MTTRIPKPIAGRDVRSLPLAPQEAYLLSRVDGRATERDLASATGLSPDVVEAALDRLAALGAIDAPPSAAAVARAAAAAAAAKPKPKPRVAPEVAQPPLVMTPELEEAIELEIPKRLRILDLFGRLDRSTHYELLGVKPEVDKKAIKSAYYALAPEFHPDKYFRREIGTFRHRIEAIFSRITLAHDILTVKEKRAEYDEYLAQTQQNRDLAALLDDPPADVATSLPPPPSEPTSVRPAQRPSAAPAPAPPRDPVADRAALDRERRELLAKKLKFRSGALPGAARASQPSPPPQSRTPAPASAVPAPPPSSPGPSAESRAAAEALKVRYDNAVEEAKFGSAARHGVLGRLALAQGDFASAANLLRLASGASPEDAELAKLAAEARQKAAAVLAEGYLKQAEYEASQGLWADAALAYARVCIGRPDDAYAHERAAFAALKGNGSTRRAVELARRAVELLPTSAEYRVTLARAYRAAGFDLSSRKELERARELAPDDPKIVAAGQDWNVGAAKVAEAKPK